MNFIVEIQKTVTYVTETLSYLAPKIWPLAPEAINNPFRTNAPVMFSVFRILAPYVDTNWINCNMNELFECYSIYVSLGSVKIYGSIGTKYIKTYLDFYFLFTSLCLYISMYTLCACLPPGHRA